MNNMSRRNGNLLKGVVVSATLLCGVYFIYIYNNTSGKLKSTERIAERYRREQESLRTQLQELTAAKDDMQQRSENEKKEFINRLNTLNQHHKMLKSQHDDLQADYSRLQSEKEKDKEDTKLQEIQRNQEYMQLKQEKELEISSLRDQLANLGRDKEDLTDQITKIAAQLKDSQKRLSVAKDARSSLQTSVGKLKKQQRLEQAERVNLEQQIQEIKKQVDTGARERTGLERQMEEIKQHINLDQEVKRNLEKQNADMKQTIFQYETNFQFARQQMQQYQDKFYTEQTVIAQLEQRLKNMEREKEQIRQQNIHLAQAQQAQQAQKQLGQAQQQGAQVQGGQLAQQQQQQQQGQPQQQQGLFQQNQGIVQQKDSLPQLNQLPGEQAQQNLQFQPVQGQPPKQMQGFLMGNNNPLVGDNQHQGGDNQAAQQNQGVQEMQQQHIVGDKKISDNLMEQQQQQHQVQAPNLNAGQGDKSQYGELKKLGIDPSQVKVKQDANANAVLDAEQQQHQMAPPGEHIKVDKPDSNMAVEMDKNPLSDKNVKNGKHDSNQAGEMEPDPKADSHVGPAPPANDNVDPPNIGDNPQQNIPPPGENDPFVGQDNDGLDNWNGVNPLVDDRYQKFQENADEDEKKALDEDEGKDGDNKDEDYEDDYDDKGEDKEDEPVDRQDNNPPDPFANKAENPFVNNQ